MQYEISHEPLLGKVAGDKLLPCSSSHGAERRLVDNEEHSVTGSRRAPVVQESQYQALSATIRSFAYILEFLEAFGRHVS